MTDPCHVLIVDDEEDTRELLALSLGRCGMIIDTAENGEVALSKLNDSFHVLVTDLVMPKVDGISLLSSVNDKKIRVIKIVITSFADNEKIKSALSVGADYILEKPFSGAQLKAVIENLYKFHDPLRAGNSEHFFSGMFQRRLQTLPITGTERRMVSLVASGATDEAICIALGLSEQTVRNRMLLIYKKLKIVKRSEIFDLLFPI